MTVDAIDTHKNDRRDYGFDPTITFLLQAVPLIILNVYAFSTMNGGFLLLSLLLDIGMALPLLISGSNAYTFKMNRHKLSLSGLMVDQVVTAKSGAFLAFDTHAGKVFANGRVRDISDIETAQWKGQGNAAWVEVTFKTGPGALLRMPVKNDFHGADVVAKICQIACLTLG